MHLSGFSVARNAIDLDYPIVESIRSILPIVDDFVVALGDSYDNTTEVVRSINSPKLVIMERKWDASLFDRGAILAHETNAALGMCKGSWCIYLQADEVIHEKYLQVIVEACRKYQDDPEVEAFLLSYKHFWGDYYRYQKTRNWYRREIRVIRNNIGAQSWKSAQGFRIDGRKMRAVLIPVEVYHYGWVRNPHKMKRKRVAHDSLHHDQNWIEKHYQGDEKEKPFEFGSLENLAVFTGTPPEVMKRRIAEKDWSVDTNHSVDRAHKHNQLGVRVLSAIERFLGTHAGEYRNYIFLARDEELTRYIQE